MVLGTYVYLHDDRARTIHNHAVRPSVGVADRKIELASVISEVFPEPLGPISKKEDKVVAEVDRYITRCKNSGTESTRSVVIAMTRGEGPISKVSQLWGAAHDMV